MDGLMMTENAAAAAAAAAAADMGVDIEVVVIEYNAAMRGFVHLLMRLAGYTVTTLPTFDAALCHLRTCVTPMVVVLGNATPDNRLVAGFFATAAAETSLADGPRAAARQASVQRLVTQQVAPRQAGELQSAFARHRYVLLTTTPEHLPSDLRVQLAQWGVPILRKPCLLEALLQAVDAAARSLSR